jgi:hypothetical protein
LPNKQKYDILFNRNIKERRLKMSKMKEEMMKRQKNLLKIDLLLTVISIALLLTALYVKNFFWTFAGVALTIISLEFLISDFQTFYRLYNFKNRQ